MLSITISDDDGNLELERDVMEAILDGLASNPQEISISIHLQSSPELLPREYTIGGI